MTKKKGAQTKKKAKQRRKEAQRRKQEQAKKKPVPSGNGAVLPCEAPSLKIIEHPHHFAPGHEEMEVVFRAKNLFGSGFIARVHCSGSGEFDTLVYEEPLLGANDADYTASFSWIGRGNKGKLDEVWLSPTHAPLRVTILTDDGELLDSVVVWILVADVSVRLGRFWCKSEDPPARGSEAWVRLRLNELGYFGGPVEGDIHGYQAKAVAQYRSQHSDLAHDPKALDDDLYTALENGDNARPWITAEQSYWLLWEKRQAVAAETPLNLGDEEKRIRVNAEASVYQAAGEVNELRDQYDDEAVAKHVVEAARFNRPIVPLECEIFLRSTDDEVVRSRVLDGVAVAWTYDEPKEELDRQHEDDEERHSYPRKYVKLAKGMNGCGEDDDANNCPVELGGIRGQGGSREAFLVDAGKQAHYAPYTSAVNGEEVVSFAYVGDDEGCQCRAGILFRPSFIAGDMYRIKATVSFAGHARQKSLEEANLGSDGEPISDTTNPIEIWRQAKVAAVIGWPGRKLSKGDWQSIEREYERCYLDVDVSAVQMVPITDVIDDDDYSLVVKPLSQKLEIYQKRGDGPPDLEVNPHVASAGLIGFSGAWDLRRYDSVLTAMAAFLDSVSTEEASRGFHQHLEDRLHQRARERFPNGLVFLDYSAIGNIRIVDDRGQRVASTEEVWRGAVSLGMQDGLVYVCKETPGTTSFIFTHEMGHCLWLRHAPGTPDPGFDHDHSDEYCMMSYPDFNAKEGAWNHPSQFSPRFCGRCNLKLRGWDVSGDRIPDASGLVRDGRKVIPYEDLRKASQGRREAESILAKYSWIRGANLGDRFALLRDNCFDGPELPIDAMPAVHESAEGRFTFRATNHSTGGTLHYQCKNHGKSSNVPCFTAKLEKDQGVLKTVYSPRFQEMGCYEPEVNIRAFVGLSALLGRARVILEDGTFYRVGSRNDLDRRVVDAFAYGQSYFQRFGFSPDFATAHKDIDPKAYEAALKFAKNVPADALDEVVGTELRNAIGRLSNVVSRSGKTLGKWWRSVCKAVVGGKSGRYADVVRVHKALFTTKGCATSWVDNPVWEFNVGVLEAVTTFVNVLQEGAEDEAETRPFTVEKSSLRARSGSSKPKPKKGSEKTESKPKPKSSGGGGYEPDVLTPGGAIATRITRLRCLAQVNNTCGQRAAFNALCMVGNPHNGGGAEGAMNNGGNLRALGPMNINIADNDVRGMLNANGGRDVALLSDFQHARNVVQDPTFIADDGDHALYAFKHQERDTLHLVVNTLAYSIKPGAGLAKIGHYIAVELHWRVDRWIDVAFADSLSGGVDRTALLDGLLDALGFARE